MADDEDLTEVGWYTTLVAVTVSVTTLVVQRVDVTVLCVLLYPPKHEVVLVPLLHGYGGGSQEDTGVGVEYRLALDLVTTRVAVAVLVSSFVEVSDFVVLWGVATGGW